MSVRTLLCIACCLIAANASPGPILTKEEGIKIAETFITSMTEGFRANDFSSQKPMLAKSMKWQLSGSRVSGMGTKEDCEC